MHIPNGFLDPKVSAGTAFAAAGVLGYCLAKVKLALSALAPGSIFAGAGNIGSTITENSRRMISSFAENHLMKMGAIGSLIFAAQMFNFPVAGGTSGHLLGGVIAGVALGPFSGAIVIATVLAVQSVFFADGGITALGANMLNMAVIGTFACYYIYYAIHRMFKGYYSGIAIASFLSVVLASAACAVEIALSGTAELGKVLPAMVSVHSIIGIAEALLTIVALGILKLQKFEFEGLVKLE